MTQLERANLALAIVNLTSVSATLRDAAEKVLLEALDVNANK